MNATEQAIYRLVAALAVALGTPFVQASSSYVTMKLGAVYWQQHVRKR